MDDRCKLREAGRALRDELALPEHLHAEVAPGYADLFDEVALGAIWNRDGLGRRERAIVTLAALTALERHALAAPYAGAAMRIGLDRAAIAETVLQVGLYIGFPAAEITLRAMEKVIGEAGPPADDGEAEPSAAELDEAGAAFMHALHGTRSQAGYASPDWTMTRDLYRLAIRYGYGVLWRRPGLDRRERTVVSITAFAVLEQHDPLVKFTRSALESELTVAEVTEALMQTAPYAGFPRALTALAAIENAL